MLLTSIGQGPGNVATLPGPPTGDALPSLRGDPPPATGGSSSRGSDLEAAFARVAWFDVNGDGHIDNRSPLSGGDGTLLVPKHAVRLQLYSREVRQEMKLPAAHDAHDTAAEPASPAHTDVAASGVATRQAIDAYQRYGQPTDHVQTDRAVA